MDWLRNARCSWRNHIDRLLRIDQLRQPQRLCLWRCRCYSLGIQSYSRTDELDPSHNWAPYFHVQDAGSTLSLPNLTEVWPNGDLSVHFLEAHYGDNSCSHAQQVGHRDGLLRCSRTGGLIDIPSITSFTDSSTEPVTASGFAMVDAFKRHHSHRSRMRTFTSIKTELFDVGSLQLGSNTLLHGNGTLDGSVQTSGRIQPGNNLGPMSITVTW